MVEGQGPAKPRQRFEKLECVPTPNPPRRKTIRGDVDPSGGALASVAVLGLLCTALALVLMAVLVSEAGPGRALVITYVNPVIAVALGVIFLGEEPGAGAIFGLAAILAGSWLATRGGPPAEIEPGVRYSKPSSESRKVTTKPASSRRQTPR